MSITFNYCPYCAEELQPFSDGERLLFFYLEALPDLKFQTDWEVVVQLLSDQ